MPQILRGIKKGWNVNVGNYLRYWNVVYFSSHVRCSFVMSNYLNFVAWWLQWITFLYSITLYLDQDKPWHFKGPLLKKNKKKLRGRKKNLWGHVGNLSDFRWFGIVLPKSMGGLAIWHTGHFPGGPVHILGWENQTLITFSWNRLFFWLAQKVDRAPHWLFFL